MTTAEKKGFKSGMPPRSGWYFVYRKGGQLPSVAYWDFDGFRWSASYGHHHGVVPDIDSMKRTGHVKWNAPDVMYEWKEHGQ